MNWAQSRRGLSRLELEDEVANDLQRATGLADVDAQDANRLNRVLQLTGAAPSPPCSECASRLTSIVVCEKRMYGMHWPESNAPITLVLSCSSMDPRPAPVWMHDTGRPMASTQTCP